MDKCVPKVNVAMSDGVPSSVIVGISEAKMHASEYLAQLFSNIPYKCFWDCILLWSTNFVKEVFEIATVSKHVK